ncbi:MAG: putative glutamate--cysteine ligase, partial [Kovacikia sp.]
RAQDLITLTDANEAAASRLSLDAHLTHWQTGQPILAREWVEQLYDEVWTIAKKQGFSCFLTPLKKILREGNEAQRWLNFYDQGMDIASIVKKSIQDMANQEFALRDSLCQPLVA